MKKYLKEYVAEIDTKLAKQKKWTKPEIDEHLVKIKFFQHERIVHLFVTLFYALFLLGFLFLSLKVPLFLIIVFILGIFLIFYVLHYFFLENNVQYLYKQYDQMQKKKETPH